MIYFTWLRLQPSSQILGLGGSVADSYNCSSNVILITTVKSFTLQATRFFSQFCSSLIKNIKMVHPKKLFILVIDKLMCLSPTTSSNRTFSNRTGP